MLVDLSATMGRSRMRRGTSLEVISEENSFASLSSTDATHDEFQAAMTSSMQHRQVVNAKRSLTHINPFGTGPRKKSTSVESLLAESPDDDWGIAEYVEPEVKEVLAKNGHMRISSDHGNYASLMTTPIMATPSSLTKQASSAAINESKLNGHEPHAHQQLSVDDGLGEEILTESSSSVNTSHDDDDIIHGSRPGSTNGQAMFILPEPRSLQQSALLEETDEEAATVTPKPAPRKSRFSMKRNVDGKNETAEAHGKAVAGVSVSTDACEDSTEQGGKTASDDESHQRPCIEDVQKESIDNVIIEAKVDVAEPIIAGPSPSEDAANVSVKLEEKVLDQAGDESLLVGSRDSEVTEISECTPKPATPADPAVGSIENADTSSEITMTLMSNESPNSVDIDGISPSTPDHENKKHEDAALPVSAENSIMDTNENIQEPSTSVSPEPEKQPVESVIIEESTATESAEAIISTEVSIETFDKEDCLVSVSDVDLESHTESDVTIENREDSVTSSICLSERAVNKHIILIDGYSEAETASNESSPPLEGRYDIWPTSPMMSDDFARDFSSHQEEKAIRTVRENALEELMTCEHERLVDEDSRTFASLRNEIEGQINALSRQAEQHSPQRRSSAKFLEKYTSNPNLLLINDDIVIHDTSPPRPPMESKSDDEEKQSLATPPKNREVDPKELPQPLTVKKVRALFEQFSQHQSFDSARLKSVKRNPESMILRRGSSGQAMLEEGVSTQRPFVKALSFYRYLSTSSDKQRPNLKERRKFKRTTSDEYDPRQGWRCWSPIISDDEDDTDGNCDFVRDYPTFLRTKQVDQSVLNKLRTFGTSVTYFGGRVIENQPYSNNTFAREIMKEIRRENGTLEINNKQVPPKVIGCIFKQDCR